MSELTSLEAAPGTRFSTELKALLRLGSPIAATQFFVMAMGFLDTAMAGRYDSVHLAGVALGGAVMWPVFMLTSGVTMALTPIVAQLRGAGATDRSGSIVRQGLWVGLLASIACVLVITNSGPIFALTGVNSEVAAIAEGYLQAASWGMPPVQV
ncbi:MAG: MATE family efflux transporter, partial [Gammaproteobacteria bacterium]